MHASTDWQPTANLDYLRRAAELLDQARDFLKGRGYWEVRTPLLSADVCVDAHLDPFGVDVGQDRPRYLQTSPEFAMKRLIAAGAGSIFQVATALRQGEEGRLHNPEFTLIEWYRVGGDYHELMTEVGELATHLLGVPPAVPVTYADAFEAAVGLCPLTAEVGQLEYATRERGFYDPKALRDDLLDFLFATVVQPTLGHEAPCVMHDFPPSQAALARVRPSADGDVAERFELFVNGLELCNGYQEETDPAELRRRFAWQDAIRETRRKPTLPLDSRLLSAMEAGLPRCTGVALGFDRVVMLAVGASEIAEVIPFPFDRA